MKYLNIADAFLSSPDYLRATPSQRGTWLSLIGYCHRQMNSGTIANYPEWNASMWHGIAVEPEIVAVECSLWKFRGLMLDVVGYDLDAERDYLTKKRKGHEYAMRRWNKKEHVKPVGDGSPIGSPNGSAMGHPMRKEGRKEGSIHSPKPPKPTRTPPKQ